jgi:hypothetical protein
MKKITIISALFLFSIFNSYGQYDEYVPSTYVPIPYGAYKEAARSINDQNVRANQSCINNLKSYYSQIQTYPNIQDGYYEVYATDEANFTMCEKRRIRVTNNKVTEYYAGDNYKRTISQSFLITNAKSSIMLDDQRGKVFLTLYFLK